ncbi:hypothetical protein SPSIL_052580 [Sporomusa silvacetica DSM 10669]|uniref:Uncharacterized protein n=1 Tax=Sporomusa silvacetica DSM 10669 TaxID=1123289 RepID=A0ABZ3ITW6_9FIRM|nr:hypothetical protein [Sporomusa silvacetica]OZC19651.1 hypothetical protein SPSIL_20810 [Sporomusa silvacetica DSM 10669]
MKYTLPSSAYVERPAEFSIIEGRGCVAEIKFDILGSNDNIIYKNTQIGEIHGYLLNVDRMERDGYRSEDEYCNGDDVSDIYWSMHDDLFGNNEKSKIYFT